MDNRKIKKIIILIAIFIVALILLEVLIRFAVSTTKNIVDNHNEKVAQEKYEQTEEYKEEIYLEDCIEKAILLMKSEDYETLYSLLDSTYKEYMNFTSIDAFKEYMIKYIGIPTDLNLIDYYKNNEKYVCTFRITNEIGSNTRKILIEETNEKDSEYNFNLTFDEIYYIKDYGTSHQMISNNVKYQVAYKVKYSGYSVYLVKITNNQNKSLNFSLADTYVRKTNKQDYYAKNSEELSNISVNTGETLNVKFKIEDSTSYMYEENYMYINPVINGKESLKAIKISLERNYCE